MASITFHPDNITVTAEAGEALNLVAARAGVPLRADCGGQGACRRCAAVLESGELRTRAGEPVGPGEVLTCQVVVAGDATIAVLDENRAADIAPFAQALGRAAEHLHATTPRWPLASRMCVTIAPPDKGDSLTDLDRLVDSLREADVTLRRLSPDLATLRALPGVLRGSEWRVCATVVDAPSESRLVQVAPACDMGRPAFGAAIDVGTSTVAVSLVSLRTGRVVAAAGRRNGQVRYGDDVISRIIWSEEHDNGTETMRRTAVETVNEVIGDVRRQVGIKPEDTIAVACAANSTMMNFLLGIEAGPIRRDPHTPPASWLPLFTAEQLALDVWSRAPVMCLPTVSGFVGADITAGVLATGMADTDELTVLVDVGTNGEIVVGKDGWLVCASCSAGPAFEGVGIECGMHGGPGAIDSVRYDPATDAVSLSTIGGRPPLGVCGTGFIDTLATLFEGGLVDRAGQFVADALTQRLRPREYETEFVICRAGEHDAERDMTISQSEIENLIRSKAAVHAGLATLLSKLHLEPESIARLYLAGAFGSHLDVRRAVTIGMLPDLGSDQVQYVGNTSLAGAQLCVLSREARAKVREIAAAMTYVELSVEPGFMEEYVASMFLPHTDTERFPSVAKQATG